MKRFIFSTLLLCSLFVLSIPSFAALIITPTHLVMEGRERMVQVVLVNNGASTNTYRLEWQQLNQVEGKGGYIEVDGDDGKLYLKDFAVFSPRQITLGPGEKQTVRVGIRRPADLPDGEYRSHLNFRITDRQDPVTPSDNLKENETRVAARVLASYSIPAIYRKGEYDVNITIGQPSFDVNPKTGKMIINLPVSRSGNHGVIGLVEVFHTPIGGQETRVASLANANLFTDITQRTFRILSNVEGLSAGTMRVVFNKTEGKTETHYAMTEKSFPISN